MLEMSSGFKSFRRLTPCPPELVELPPPPPLELFVMRESTRMPSMNTSGSLDSEIEDAPRIRMRGAAPVAPDPCVTVTPGSFDWRTSAIAAFGTARINSCVLSTATCAGCERRVCSPPVPVTTISFSVSATSDNWKFTVTV